MPPRIKSSVSSKTEAGGVKWTERAEQDMTSIDVGNASLRIEQWTASLGEVSPCTNVPKVRSRAPLEKQKH